MEDNARYFIKSIVGDTAPVNTMSQENLQALRRAVLNAQQRAADWQADVGLHGVPYDDAGADYHKMMATPYIDYQDYELGGRMMPFDNPSLARILKDSKGSPAYNMATTIGRAYYTQRPNGDIYLTDTYDMPKDIGVASKGLQFLQDLGANVGKPYQINLNLGNPKNWKF